MNKTEFIAAVAEKTGITKEQSKKIFAAAEEVIYEAIANGEKISIVGLGTLEVKERKGRVGRNPRTGEQTFIPAAKGVSFKAGKALKEAVK